MLIITATFFILLSITLSGCEVQAEKPGETSDEGPIINYFMASTDSIRVGDPVTLHWDVSNADNVNIYPDIGNVVAAGNITWYPSTDITYTLIAENARASETMSISINIVEEQYEFGCTVIGCDPVSGRNQSILLELEQLCLSTQYQVQIAKDQMFSLMIYDSGEYSPYSTTSPKLLYPAGGLFECGHKYYVRYRARYTATNQAILSPWSHAKCYIISPGFAVTSPHN